jgi:ribonuclease E
MANPTTPAVEAASVPDPALVARAEAFTHERFIHEGEDAAVALAPGSARRRSLDAAIAEIEAGAKVPSTKWRRRYALLLGLERVLSEDEPRLADGTLLNPHQVDALSGTLVALLAQTQKGANGSAVAEGAAPVLAVDEAPVPLESAAEPEVEDEDEDEPDEDDEPDDDDEDDEDDDDDGEPVDVDIAIEDLEDEPDEPAEEESYDDDVDEDVDEDVAEGAADDPNAHKRFWFEHATGAGKTVAAMGFVEASRTGGVLILTHRRNLVDQFLGELHTRGYGNRESPPLLDGEDADPIRPRTDGPVTVETYQWFVRNAGRISDAYTIVICDEAHTALGDKTSAAIRAWTGPIFVGMTATGALIARHVTDLFPTQTSRFDLAQAARRGVIAPLRSIRIPPGPGVRTIAKVPLRKGEVDVEFDQEMLAELLDQLPFNLAIADLYKTRFNGVPGVVYAAGVRHAMNVAQAFRDVGIKAQGVSGETPKRELAEILAKYERGEIDVLVNAQLLAEGWNSPRATICMHLAPTASKRIYQQRVGRVTRRHPGKESGIVVDFVHPATRHDDPVVTLHSLLDRDVYRGGAIVVGPVRRGRGRRVRVERRVIPVCAEEDRRIEVFERELWRIAVEFLDYGEQVQWAALAGARVAPSGWRRARAMLHFDKTGDLKRSFLLTAVERNKNSQLRLRALQEIAQSRDADAFERAVDIVRTWSRDERREGVKILLQALAERRIGRRDQASHWIWDLADMTRDVHEEYAVQRWPETKRLLGLLVNSSGGAHARNARRLVHGARKQDRRLSAALLAAAVAHTPEAMEVVRGARTRMARKPSALSRELLRNFPKRKTRTRRRKKKGDEGKAPQVAAATAAEAATVEAVQGADGAGSGTEPAPPSKSKRRREARKRKAAAAAAAAAANEADGAAGAEPEQEPVAADGAPVDAVQDAARAIAEAAAAVREASGQADGAAEPAEAEAQSAESKPKRKRATPKRAAKEQPAAAADADGAAEVVLEGEALTEEEAPPPRRRRAPVKAKAEAEAQVDPDAAGEPAEAEAPAEEAAPKPRRRRTAAKAAEAEAAAAEQAVEAAPPAEAEEEPKPKAKPRRKATAATAEDTDVAAGDERPKAKPRRKATAATAEDTDVAGGDAKPKRRRATAKAATATEPDTAAEDEKPKRRRATGKAATATEPDAAAEDEKPKRRRPTVKVDAEAAEPEAPSAGDEQPKPKPRARRAPVKAPSEPEQLSLDGDAADAPAPAAPSGELDAA